jgi:outer membrane receptor for ferrienterochelin and colicin
VTDAKSHISLPGATIIIRSASLWAVTNQQGNFTLTGVQAGQYVLEVSYVGYVTKQLPVDLRRGDIRDLRIEMQENTLALDDVVVTAQAPKNEVNTTYTIGNKALEHLQVSNISDIGTLLPGGKTVQPDLTKNNVFALRSGGSTAGNAAFGTAIQVDGVRIGNNGSFGTSLNSTTNDLRGGMRGIDTRSISLANIESVDVMTGVASAEYGDLSSGLVNIHTQKGRTPWQIVFTINPRTEGLSFAKGISLQKNRGVINFSGDWAHAVAQLESPYDSYTRRGLTFNYKNTFNRVLTFNIGAAGNIGGQNTKDDPDAYVGEFTKARDNTFRANTSLLWLVNRPWVTNLSLEASVNYEDNLQEQQKLNTSATNQPGVTATEEGYFLATQLPTRYYSNQVIDSKEVDYAASLKYEWNRLFGPLHSKLKAGLQWKSTGNLGKGYYYRDPSLILPVGTDNKRPQDYSTYPFLNNLSAYAEEDLTLPIGTTRLNLRAGLRWNRLFISDTQYRKLQSLSPRLNAKWQLTPRLAIRGGWGIANKLPSFYVLYPVPTYQDVRTFDYSYPDGTSSYVYYTRPKTLEYNRDLKWQRNINSEVAVDLTLGRTKLSLTGFFNRTKHPYKYSNYYTPYTYNVLQLPTGYAAPAHPQIRVDQQTGMVYMRGDDQSYWTPMDVRVANQSFLETRYADNGGDVVRRGAELVVDFPEIPIIRTQFRVDASYTYTKNLDNALEYYYRSGTAYAGTDVPNFSNRSYQYVGIYANGDPGSSTVTNGRTTKSLDANITATTHLPEARLIVSVKLEAALLRRMQNLSEYNGGEYAFNSSEDSNDPTGGSIYDGGRYATIWPVAYMGLDGQTHPFTATEAADPRFQYLILKSGNAYTFSPDGYDPYFSANLNVTKEIGNHVSLSLNVVNFTKARPYVKSHANGVSTVFTPNFYYGLTCRIKL